MILNVVSAQATDLYDLWIRLYDPDCFAESYYDKCEFADILTYRVIEPLRESYLKQCKILGYGHAEAVRYLYKILIHYDNEDDVINHKAVEVMINLIEDYEQPYDCKIKILDHVGNCLLLNNTDIS